MIKDEFKFTKKKVFEYILNYEHIKDMFDVTCINFNTFDEEVEVRIGITNEARDKIKKLLRGSK